MKLKRVYIEISNVCNLSCSFCAQRHTAPRYLQKEQFAYILEQVKPLTSFIYLHVLGEPLAHPQLDELLTLCDAYQMQVQLTTNGTLLAQTLPLLKRHAVRQINISVHSFSQQSRAQQERYVKEVLKAGDELSAASYVAYRLWCLHNGRLDVPAREVCERILAHYGRSAVKIETRRLSLAQNRFLNFDEVFEWPSLTRPFVSETGTCRGLRDMIAILSNGDVVPCCLDAYGEAKLGNVFTAELSSILAQESVRKMREGFCRRKVWHPLCQRCTYRARFDRNIRPSE